MVREPPIPTVSRTNLPCRKIKVLNLATGDIVDDTANVLVTARGQLNEIKWPPIPGLENFKGKKMHSGAWDPRLVPT